MKLIIIILIILLSMAVLSSFVGFTMIMGFSTFLPALAWLVKEADSWLVDCIQQSHGWVYVGSTIPRIIAYIFILIIRLFLGLVSLGCRLVYLLLYVVPNTVGGFLSGLSQDLRNLRNFFQRSLGNGRSHRGDASLSPILEQLSENMPWHAVHEHDDTGKLVAEHGVDPPQPGYILVFDNGIPKRYPVTDLVVRD